MKRILSILLALVLVCGLLPWQSMTAQAKTGGKLVAMTFDDGPSSQHTTELLNGLKERNVPVTFFMLGERTPGYRTLIQRAYREGHEIATHTWDHSYLTKLTPAEIQTQLSDCIAELERATGAGADFLVRPPYGSIDEKVRSAVPYPLISWSMDSEDWSLRNVDKVRDKIVSEVYDGCIILCHDIHKTTIPAALEAIDVLMDQGYEFVTVSELFRRRGQELKPHEVYYQARKKAADPGPIPAPRITCALQGGQPIITITCDDDNVPIYYTLDGSYPNQEATRYTGSFAVDMFTQINAVAAYKLNGSRSATTTFSAEQYPVGTPTVVLNQTGAVIMQTVTEGAEIYYTTDGTTPGPDSHLYHRPIYLLGDSTLRVVAIHPRGNRSAEHRSYLSCCGDLYYDISVGQWFYESMDWAHRMGILQGVAPHTMAPSSGVTRGMMATFLYRFSGEVLEEGWQRTNTFVDVKQTAYYAEAIEWAYRSGITQGYSSALFGPDDVLTREQMCKMVNTFLKYLGMPLEEGQGCSASFRDRWAISNWALKDVEAMAAAGLIQGIEGNMCPTDGTNRAQMCVVLWRVREFIESYVFPEDSQEPPTFEEHTCTWMINKTDVTIRVGESFQLYLVCSYPGCHERTPVTWTAEHSGVVSIDGTTVTGKTAGARTWVYAERNGETYRCIVRVRGASVHCTHRF